MMKLRYELLNKGYKESFEQSNGYVWLALVNHKTGHQINILSTGEKEEY